ncbi:MAG: CoA transferase [Chloroflexi bacterium]|nr:CoA transferase [Chloroflexota bacterium]
MRLDLLEGVRVVEVGAMWAGPYAARILGDLGAEVIKVEGPRKPEAVRFGFYAQNDPGEKPWERGGHFQKFSRNKRDWVVDLTQPRGRELLHALLRKSDILIENNTPRVRERLGLGHETLAREAPDLIVVSMPGFGDTGPYRDYLAFGLNMEGFAGLTSVTGYADGTPPIRSAIPYGDPVAALYGALSALLGLRGRAAGEPAPRFEVSQMEGLVSLLPDVLIEAQVTNADPARVGNADPLLYARQGTVRAGPNGWLAVSLADAEQVERVSALIGRPATVTDERAFWAALEEWATAVGRDDALRQLAAAGIAAAPVLPPGEMMHHEQVVARGVYRVVDHPIAGPIPYSQLPLHFANAPARPDMHAPLFGQDNRYVYGELLGLSDAEIAGLYASGITSDAPDLG